MAEEEKEKKQKTKRPTALKRDIQSVKRRLRNRSMNSRVHTAIRALKKAVADKNADLTNTCLSQVYKLVDKGVKTHLLKKNTAARIKSRLSTHVLSVKG